jgi:hypothetical protein
MIPMPMPLSGPPPKRPRVPVNLPSRALLTLLALPACQPAYANGFDAAQMIGLLAAAKTAAEWAAGIVALLGGALVVVLWRLAHTLTRLDQRVAHVEEEHARLRDRHDDHERDQRDSIRRVHERLEAVAGRR